MLIAQQGLDIRASNRGLSLHGTLVIHSSKLKEATPAPSLSRLHPRRGHQTPEIIPARRVMDQTLPSNSALPCWSATMLPRSCAEAAASSRRAET